MSNDGQPKDWFTTADGRPKYSLDARILAAGILSLVFAIVLVVFLHLYIRYALRRREAGRRRRGAAARLFRVDLAAAVHDEAPKAGLDPRAIAALPTFPYQSSSGGAGDHGKEDAEESTGTGAECAVCLSAIEEGESVRLLPGCGHVFHVGCIDMWLGSQSTCPVCRARVEPAPAAAAASELGQVGQSSAQELAGGEGTSGVKDGGTSAPPSRLSSSFRRMMSWERSERRSQADEVEADVERQ